MAPTKARALRYLTPEESSNSNEERVRNKDKKLKREWDTPKRVRVKTLHELGYSRKAIEQRENVPTTT